MRNKIFAIVLVTAFMLHFEKVAAAGMSAVATNQVKPPPPPPPPPAPPHIRIRTSFRHHPYVRSHHRRVLHRRHALRLPPPPPAPPHP